MDQYSLRNKVAIVGVGIAKSLRHADVPIGSLAIQTAESAIKDAGLKASDIDGVACGTSLPAYAGSRVMQAGFDFVDSAYLTEHMELKPVWQLDHDSFPPALAFAIQAVASGAATYVLVNRTLHNPVGRYNAVTNLEARGNQQWTAPYGLVAASSLMGSTYMEYLKRYGAKREHMATLAVQQRKNVQQIPEAYWHGRELTVDDYMESRIISEPMCLFDNDIPVDGGASFIVTTAERAADLPNKPVYFTAWAKVRQAFPNTPGTLGPMDEFYDRGFDVASRLWKNSGWTPNDIDIVQLYDGFTPLVWFWLEVLGFCPRGEAWNFIQGGTIDADGPFPLNSGGGNQGWGRVHGVPHVLECYWQLAGRAGKRQTQRAETGISTYATPAHEIGTAFLYSTDPTA